MGMRFRSLLRPRHELAWYCSTARNGSLPAARESVETWSLSHQRRDLNTHRWSWSLTKDASSTEPFFLEKFVMARLSSQVLWTDRINLSPFTKDFRVQGMSTETSLIYLKAPFGRAAELEENQKCVHRVLIRVYQPVCLFFIFIFSFFVLCQ